MKRLTKIAPLLVGATILGGRLYAQTAPAPTKAAPTAHARAQISPEQMQRDAQTSRDAVRGHLQRMYYLQAQAHKQNDVIKLTCVNDKFVTLKAEANLFDDAQHQLLIVLQTNERFDAYDRMATSAETIRRIREEADGCIGEPELARISSNAS